MLHDTALQPAQPLCAIRVLFVIPWWTFSIKRDEEPKDTSKYIFMSIY